MKTKSIIGTILGLALTTTIALPVKADEYNCRIDRRTGMEICENRDRRNDRYDRVERRIDELYREVLGRRADREGLRLYSDRVNRQGWRYDQVRRNLAQSPEAIEQIRNSYRQIYRRNPDSETIRRYQNDLATGSSLDEVRRDIQDSRRNTGDRRNDRYDRVERRIDELYREVLGRRADREGLRLYTDRVNRQGWRYPQVRRNLAQSPEAIEQIRNTYRQIHRRNPDSETIRRYQNDLATGSSLDEVRRDMQDSRNTGSNDRYYNSVERNIDRLYREVLGRRADENGLRTYSDRIERDRWTYERVRLDLAESTEATEQIRKAYREIQGENPDSRTIRRYQNDLARGSSLYEIRQEMQNSRNTRRNNRRYRYY
ncbi:MAG: DUF4214 domain-containing protein [Prochloraceae cyanobacterium]|nr:DUF4214 domain-containing protein [Prochloraceae cyanobacterium]